MNSARAVPLFLVAMLLVVTSAFAQAPRTDAIWAKRAHAAIVLNGVLSEAAWAVAESVVIQMAQDAGPPGSGWKYEGGILPVDPTHATIKFLVRDNQLYMGVKVRDKSIGGSQDFNRFDGFLMGLKDHASTGSPKPVSEYFYSWWYPAEASPPDPQPVGWLPSFVGRWATWPPGTARTPEQIAAWDAVTTVQGQTNTDATNDVGYTVEMRFDLNVMGYDVTRPEGDIVEFNISLYDCDWLWPLDAMKLSYNRVWWQDPWGNTSWYDEVHIFARPDVTVESTNPLPKLRPEVYIPNGASFAAPTINGTLTEPVWASAYTFDLRYGDDALRQGYPGVGPHRSGQYQPPVNGGQAAIVDPADATVKIFHRGDNLYLGFDVRDQVVQYHANSDRWDGFLVSLNDKVLRKSEDNNLLGRRLAFQVNADGTALAQNYLPTLINAGQAGVALALKSNTTVDTLGQSPDVGYTAEMWIDLKGLHYPAGLGDGTLWIGVSYLDGDSFLPSTDSYGTRTWWFREHEEWCCPAWAYLAPSQPTDAGDVLPADIDASFLIGTSASPGPRPTVRYSLARASDVSLDVYDVAGRLVERQALGLQRAGAGEARFGAKDQSSGVYLYRVHLKDPSTGALRKTLSGRFVVIK